MTDRTVVYRLQSDVRGMLAGTAAASASLRKLGDDATALNKQGEKARKGLETLGGAAGKAGLVAAAGLGAALVKAANFDQAMSNVQAATHESAAAMEDLRQAALDAGADTAFSATEAAAGIENLAKAGVSTTEILNGGLTGALDLAAAGGMDVASAAEAAAGAMAQFKLEGDQVPHVADLMAAAAGKAQGDVSDMVMALKQGGTVAAQTGLSIEETTASFAALAEQSLLGSDAGTSFKTFLASLTPATDKARDAMAQYNISAFDAQGNFVGMTKLAGQLRAGLGDLTDEQRQVALETIFGSDAVRAASIIYDNGAEGIANWTAQVNDAGYAAETAAIKQDNLRGDIEKLGGALETALIGTGSASQGPLRSLTQGLTSVIDKYTELPQGAQNAAAGILAAGAAVGGSIWVGSKLVRGIADTREAMAQLGVTGPKAAKGMRAVAGAAAGLAVLTTAAAGVRELQQAMDESLPGTDALTGRLIDLANLPTGFSGSIGKEFDSIGDSIDRLTNKTTEQSFADAMQTPFEGLFGEAGGLREARAEIESLDQALAGLVTSGSANVAADAVKNLADQYGLTGSQVDALVGELTGYSEALASQENDAKLAAEANLELAGSASGVAQKAGLSKEALKVQAEALDDARKAARGTAESFVTLGAGLDDAKVSLGDWIAEMAKQADALNNFMDNAKRASKRGLRDGLINDLQDAGTAGALRMKQLANATDEEIAKANRAWKRGQDAMRDYVNFKVPPKKIDVNLSEFMSRMAIVRQQLDSIDRFIPVNIHVSRTGAGGDLPYVSGGQRRAEGGFITGPGTATSDSIPAYLSNGEYVMKAAAVTKYGVHMFDRLNAMHFADGGKVDKKPRKPRFGVGQFVADNTGPLEAAIDRLSDRLEDQTAAVERDTAERDYWSEKMADVAAGTTSGFNSGLFDKSGNPWADGSGGGALANLTRDIAGLSQRSALQSQLAGMGLSGDALAALLSQGSNTDISSLIASGQVSQYADLYSQRAALQGQVGSAAGQAAYGAQFAAADAAARASLVEQQKMNIELAGMSGRLASMEAALASIDETGPERTGAAVRGSVDRMAADGQRTKSRVGRVR